MANNKSGGITQYFKDKSRFSLTPEQVMIATGALVILVILFKLINPLGI